LHPTDTDIKGRLHRLLDDDGIGITVESHLLPDFLNQANALVRSNHLEAARELLSDAHIAEVEQRIAVDPSLTDLMYILAKLLQDVGFAEQAAAWYRRIVAVEPHVKVLCLLADQVKPTQAIRYLAQAHERAPHDDGILRSYAHNLLQCGRIAEGLEQYKKLQARHPGQWEPQLRILWNQHYLPGFSDAYFKTAYMQWARRFLVTDDPISDYTNTPQPDRRLKLGLISGEFRNNTPLTPFELIWTLLDRDAFELFAYSSVRESNDGTERWQGIVDVYRDIQDLDDRAAARLIHEDRIDILLEVGGYCQASRLGVMAYAPAPLQVDYGSLSTTGHPRIQYRFSCPVLTPPAALSDFTEETLYLSPMCPYAPPDVSPLVGPLPAREQGMVTFGAFNNHRKINDFALDLWAEILRQVPRSRLVLKFPEGDNPDLVDTYRQQLQRRGVDRSRVTAHGSTDHMTHLELMGRCDLMLDTYPYNAARGTMEALWMGVPTVTLVGDSFVAREGLAIQSQVGLEVFAAASPAEYIAKAVSFVRQLDHLEAIRLSLRQRMLQSPLCDPKGWTQKFAQALRGIWTRWCHEGNGSEVQDTEAVRC
jgi:predicted O-linked N-acetylglucosamine transferase (SPINDLY family)